MQRVYIVHHVAMAGTEHANEKLIGVYSSEANAKRGIRQLLVQPGFRDYPDGFRIDEIKVNHTAWLEDTD